MIPIDKVENIVSRFNELESILAKPDLKKDEFVSNSKEYSNLNEIISYAKNYLKVLEDLKSTKNILEDKSTDKEFYEMAEKELKDLKQQEEECVKRLKVFLLPKDEADEKNAIIEIRAGTGGMEAALFAADLFNMYQKVAVLNGWKVEIINLSNSEGATLSFLLAKYLQKAAVTMLLPEFDAVPTTIRALADFSTFFFLSGLHAKTSFSASIRAEVSCSGLTARRI